MIETRKSKEIVNLLSVLLAAGLAGFLCFAALIYFYGPDGRYQAAHVILSPATLEGLSYNETASKFKRAPYIFDGVNFVHWDSASSRFNQQKLDLQHYAEFYALVAGDMSVEASRQMESYFQRAAALQISIQSPQPLPAQTKLFQTIQFAEQGDHFRVELIGKEEGRFAYFHHPAILKKTEALFQADVQSRVFR